MYKKAIVITNGCPENRLDCAEIEFLLIQNECEIVTRVQDADAIIISLCGLQNQTEEKSIDLIKHITKKKKSMSMLLVTGCLPKINIESIKSIFNGHIIKGHNIKKIANYLGFDDNADRHSANYLIPRCEYKAFTNTKNIFNIRKYIQNGFDSYRILRKLQNPEYSKNWDEFDVVKPNTYYIKIASGCLHACSYCAVKLSRGKLKSNSIDDIKAQFIQGLEKGYTQFALIGTDIGSYGRDIQTDLQTLLREIVSINKKFEIKLRNLHPQLLINQLSDFMEIFSTGKISHITSAIQHGNDSILELMKRDYKIRDCKFTFNKIITKYPNIQIRSQLIVGFPGETESKFNDTLKLIDEIKLDFIEVYPFSPRMGTLAFKMPHQVSKRTIIRREYILKNKILQLLKNKKQSLVSQK